MNDATQAALVALAGKLGTTAEHLWGVLIRQARIDAWLSLGQSVVMVAVATAFFVWLSKQPELEGYNNDGAIAIRIVGSIICIALLLVVLFAGVPSVLTGFANPEAAALRDLLSAVKP